MAAPRVKVCGLTEPARVADAARLGAAYAGFVFYPPSPRCVRPDAAAAMAALLPEGVQSVGVFVDPDDGLLAAVLAGVALDVVQLHGDETPARVREVALRTGRRVMKAIRVEGAEDLAAVPAHAEAADLLLFDAKAPRAASGALPGGNGLAFDWRLLEGLDPGRPWALAGGLDASNLEAAVRLLRPPIVDVSSGVEARPGIKDPAKLEAFLQTATRLAGEPG